MICAASSNDKMPAICAAATSPHAVADHRVRLDPPRVPERSKCDLDREECGLDHVDFVEARLLRLELVGE